MSSLLLFVVGAFVPLLPWFFTAGGPAVAACRMDSLRFLLRDRDSKYTSAFDAIFEARDVEILLSPPKAPRANATCERAVGSLRREFLDRMLIYNEAHAVKVMTQYIQHYNQHRPHQARHQLPPRTAPNHLPRQLSPPSKPTAPGDNPCWAASSTNTATSPDRTTSPQLTAPNRNFERQR
ncbi:integrase core domain-containing protein [Streptomyces sp. NPDC055092]